LAIGLRRFETWRVRWNPKTTGCGDRLIIIVPNDAPLIASVKSAAAGGAPKTAASPTVRRQAHQRDVRNLLELHCAGDWMSVSRSHTPAFVAATMRSSTNAPRRAGAA
jgi:hypothetical protein